ncbi:Outer membrane scaffolding protein for murein synthesis, MipA/OmpV family [Rhizobium miluonense]|uniref:Outer membrane scaffolding protein for murein synthesis, MipA/OmpV family n=2 Tax=Rhizobium miluonense TaxID=411945 RepID=A0A1C3X368_9HYPH|nr:Outer membrane scaffolding protein for murein synthesis, MipA/OmpV family [Rhizobium miluonense]
MAMAGTGLLVTSAIIAFPASSMAQGSAKSSSDASNTSDTWVVTLGATVEYGPTYEGSKHYSFGVLPSFDLHRLGEAPEYSAPDDNFDYGLFNIGGLEIGPVVGFRDDRLDLDNLRLQSQRRVHWNLDAGGFAQYWLKDNQLRFRTEVRQSLWGGDGLIADLALDWFQPVGDKWLLSAGPRLSLANTTYMRSNFGISPNSPAVRSGRVSAFDADGGFKSVGVTVAATYSISPDWSVQVYGKYNRLIGAASDSPVTSRFGSPNQNIIGFTLNRTFNINF